MCDFFVFGFAPVSHTKIFEQTNIDCISDLLYKNFTNIKNNIIISCFCFFVRFLRVGDFRQTKFKKYIALANYLKFIFFENLRVESFCAILSFLVLRR